MRCDPYKNLANAIILFAVRDYKKYLKIIKKYPRDISTRNRARAIERFFRSDYFNVLTDIDPEFLITKIKKEIFENDS